MRRLGAALACACLFTAAIPTLAQQLSSPPVGGRTIVAPLGTATALVRQGFSDCTNNDVNTHDPSRIGGMVWVNRNTNGNTDLVIAISGTPNTSYHFFLKCVRLLGDVRTTDEGVGEATFSFPTGSVGNVFAFDVYPEGAPAGNKFQSVQVKF